MKILNNIRQKQLYITGLQEKKGKKIQAKNQTDEIMFLKMHFFEFYLRCNIG